jgi:F0F1-type ATP synthase membrane subunit a
LSKRLGAGAGLAVLLASPELVIPLIIAAVIVFAVAFTTLVVYNLVSAVIYAIGGLVFVWLLGSLSKNLLENHWWITLMVPALLLFGFISDRVSVLSWLPMRISQNVLLTYQSWSDGVSVTLVGPFFVAIVLAVIVALVILVAAVKSKRFKHAAKKL